MISLPGHRKDIVDGINGCDKSYLKKKMCMVGTSKVDDSNKRMDAHIMVGKTKSSWAITYKKLLDDNIRVYRVKYYNKHGKRETEQKMKERIYHLQDIEDVQIIGLKKKVVGLENNKHIGISSM